MSRVGFDEFRLWYPESGDSGLVTLSDLQVGALLRRHVGEPGSLKDSLEVHS